MTNRKYLDIFLSVLVLAALIFGSAGPAQTAAAAPVSPTDPSKVPHYFGPYPNWAFSPQVLADAIVTISLGTPTPVSFGNPLVGRAYATDFATPPGTLGPVFVVVPGAALPAGTFQNFQIWNQGTPGASPTTSAGNVFHAYVLRPTAPNVYTVVFDSGLLTVPVPTIADGEVATFAVTPFAVNAGDVIGFYGEGIPVDTGVAVNPDTFSYPATADSSLATNLAPVLGATISFGVDPGFPIYATQDRTYSIAATVTPSVTDPGTGAQATATVDPKTGGILTVTVTSPGAGYLIPPTVSITSPGVTPSALAVATAQISSGVINNIDVNEPGFGFITPTVTITGGNPTPGFEATAVASGGVDNIILVDGGSGYLVQPIVEFTLPNLPGGVQATGIATMDTSGPLSGTVTGVSVVNPGSGYTSAPTVTILDGNAPVVNPGVAATAVATIGIGQIDVTSGGRGYTSAPTVAITDVGGVDRGASATAMVAVKGAVTKITVTTPGAGYLTPGIKKFVDPLPGLCNPAAAPGCPTDPAAKTIPLAVPDTTTYPGSDYYEIAVVQYRMKFSSQLPDTLLRGYVQLETAANASVSQHFALTNANLDPNSAPTPILLNGSPVLAVTPPHYLGPTIVAMKNTPVRILFRNLLPTGSGGNLFLPVDTSLMGSGAGPNKMMLDANGVPMDMAPDLGTVTDGVRNPACGETPKPTDCFSENRATLHLHGGITPWISDGTPHQWTTPAGENTDYPEGVSVSNVPDMPDPGPGALTFFYTNQQSARLMFYHDHAWGITRLNVYAGEAAGYVLTDAMEQALIAPNGALNGLGVGTPLIIQDKTFVPSPAKMAQLDPTWQASRWGGEGSLWTPHVYMPAQNPGDPTGMSAFGRWFYGPWFWPPAKDAKYPPIANPYFDPNCDPNLILPDGSNQFCEPALIPSTPNVSVGMEAFNDTPIVNGAVYPTTSVDPKAYRFRILNAANDRFWNLSWYVADPRTGTLSEVALNPAEVAAAQTDPVVFPTPDTTWSPAGPNWIQIGTEGGYLPAPVVIPAHPTTWITDPTRFDVGNVDQHSLLLAPAERADVIVDFSQFRGKTLILYNDAPAAFPARVASYDYYTGGPDLSPAGAPTTLPGFGPNTRTIMQVKVSNAAPATAFDRPNTTADRMGTLVAAFAHHLDANGNPAGVFESSVDPIVVGQAAYNSAYGTNFVSNGWCNAPGSTSTNCDGFARIQEGSQPVDKFGFNTLASPNTKMQIVFQPKGLHDELNSASFDEWGRMTANLGLEAPGATPLLQNIILYPFVNPATEILDSTGLPSSLHVTPIASAADGTQIWKITHNGVDTHPIHFHLYDAQVINRVTWDNIIIPPEASELGWKDTVRVSPLEDTIVALRPIVPVIPFGVPDSKRPLNPMMPIGARGDPNSPLGTEAGFNNTDTNGNPIAPVINEVVNFGWEYVYHCHILSHEEMDMMRPVTVHVARALPDAPILSFTRGSVILHWTDGTIVDYHNPATWANAKNEAGFRIERAEVTNGAAGPFTQIAMGLANTTTYTDVPDPTTTYDYRVTAWNAAGDSPSNVIRVEGLPKAPTGLTAVVQLAPALPAGAQVALDWTNNATNATSVVVERAVGAGAFSVLATLPATGASYIDTTVLPGQYRYQVNALNAFGSSAYAGPVTVTVAQPGSTTVVLNSPNPSFVGDSVTFTAAVSPVLAVGMPSGTVAFTANGVTTPVVLDAAGVATFTTSALPAGTSTITADYSGDIIFLPSTGSATQTVNKTATTTVVVSDLNPSTAGQLVTFNATVSPAAATGTVTFNIDGANVGTPQALVGGQAAYSTAALAVGPHSVIATYSGDAAYANSPSATLTQTVNKAASTTVVVSNLNPSITGQNVSFAATVSPAAATGTVTFNIDGVDIGPAQTLVGGQAAYSTAALAIGPHLVIVTYSGDATYLPSTSATLTQTVNDKTATTTVVVSSLNPSGVGQTADFTASVGPAAATGTVTFNIDGGDVATQALVNGQATYSTAALALGTHSVIATYSGDATYLASTSATLTQTVNKAATTTVVVSSLNPSITGQNVTLAATVSPAAATGTVTFNVDGSDVAAQPLINGQAAYSTAALAIGPHLVIATYSGDAAYLPSTSATLTQTVNAKTATTTVVVSSLNPSGVGQTVAFTASVSPAAATGTVTFNIDGANVGTPQTLVNGQATYSTAALAVGTHSVIATYNGDATYLPSTSATITQTVVTIPLAPRNLNLARPALSANPPTVILTWTDRSNNEAGFLITRATNAAFTTGVTTFTVGPNVTTYTDTSVAPLTTYWYRVNAFNAAGNSSSITGTVTTRSQLPAAPAGLTVTPPAAPAGRTSLVVAWAYTSNGAPGPITFDIQRSNTGTGGWVTVANNITPATFTNTGLPPNATLYYRVRAVNAAGNSAWSTVVSGKTLP